jgi:hypothetical protein
VRAHECQIYRRRSNLENAAAPNDSATAAESQADMPVGYHRRLVAAWHVRLGWGHGPVRGMSNGGPPRGPARGSAGTYEDEKCSMISLRQPGPRSNCALVGDSDKLARWHAGGSWRTSPGRPDGGSKVSLAEPGRVPLRAASALNEDVFPKTAVR